MTPPCALLERRGTTTRPTPGAARAAGVGALRHHLAEARERAVADLLRVSGATSGEIQPVFDAILDRRTRRAVFAQSCRRFIANDPPRKDQHCGVAPQRSREHFRTLHAKIHPIILNSRQRRLRDSRLLRQFVLAQLLELPHDSNRLANRDVNIPPGFSIDSLCHGSLSPVVVDRDVDHLNQDLLANDPVDHPVLKSEPRSAVPPRFTTKRLVVETLDQSQSGGTRDSDYVLPFLVPLDHLDGEALNTAADSAVFVHLPHGQKVLYQIWYVKALVDIPAPRRP